ncbi:MULTISPECIES: hydrogenase formation protein HypD [Cyanophyceae]|uniref:hydrogenase formation protein HypD n=1 Tax=Cyanophyceae TaxID=3028117 RepID=UPI00016DC81D|nr:MULTISPECIES: hydrogenase formation protein HypD [Cyanophyceae]ACA98219.1 hydrogenase expression/formation protein HypD [Picosynechococcus sp. PCC 7002]ANV89363.1 hydrogenase formation protein HypD [Picosynechococcus sp. PCC 8807]SMH44632.1 Hydrogenase maturation protein HypD [Picosynechococcus sp. OG1]SMQ79765.1 Hydrogenase maturation protein HypD [Synechococcus sp. 7002]
MKFVDEFRDPAAVQKYVQAIAALVTRPWTIMEICGGQTHSIVKYGIDQLLPPEITLIHGPGCPVCVTPAELIDQAIALAQLPDVVLCSFGDMLRVPGTRLDLLSVKAQGAAVKMVYSPLDALKMAQENPDKQVIFFAVGFETTAPTTAMAVYQAAKLGLTNFSLLVAHVSVPPAIEAILSAPDRTIQGFLLAGHVCTVMGYQEYEAIAKNYQIPLIVTGFEPLDIVQGIYLCVKQLEEGRSHIENQYRRVVQAAGNATAQQLVTEIFEIVPRTWRGIGEISQSGLGLREKYAVFDASRKFKLDLTHFQPQASSSCISGEILQGRKKPKQCPAFGTTCTPERPLGAPMVSSEGACAAYYRYG